MDNKRLDKIVENTIRRFIKEDTKVLTNGNVEVDNFEYFSSLLNTQSQDDVWFVKIVKRKKDNPQQREVDIYLPQYYLFHTQQEMRDKEGEIKQLCLANNARAYFYANKRSKKAIDDYVKIVKASSWGRKYRGVETQLAAGQSKDYLPGRDLCFIDVDSPDAKIYAKVQEVFKKLNIKPLYTYRSPNLGWHILLADKTQAETVKRELQKELDEGYPLGRYSTAGMELDKPLLLYCNLSTHGYDKQDNKQAKLKKTYHDYERETDPRKKGNIGKYYTKMTGVDLRKEKKL